MKMMNFNTKNACGAFCLKKNSKKTWVESKTWVLGFGFQRRDDNRYVKSNPPEPSPNVMVGKLSITLHTKMRQGTLTSFAEKISRIPAMRYSNGSFWEFIA